MSQLKLSTFGTQSRKSYIVLLLLTICAFVTQLSLAAASTQEASYGNDNELHKDNDFPTLLKRPSFFVGSRYGRSSGNSGSNPANGVGTSKARRLIIVPRNDRFFLGSRYGKRSDEYLSPYEQNSLSMAMSKANSVETGLDAEKPVAGRTRTPLTMSCTYSGISNIYRCNSLNADELNMISRSEGLAMNSNSIAGDENTPNSN